MNGYILYLSICRYKKWKRKLTNILYEHFICIGCMIYKYLNRIFIFKELQRRTLLFSYCFMFVQYAYYHFFTIGLIAMALSPTVAINRLFAHFSFWTLFFRFISLFICLFVWVKYFEINSSLRFFPNQFASNFVNEWIHYDHAKMSSFPDKISIIIRLKLLIPISQVK